jgi:copper chaperone CopZ
MSLRSEMKKYFIHEKADFIDDEEAVTDFDDLKDRDIDNDGDTDESDEYLHKRLGTIAKMDESVMSDVHQMIQDAESVEDFVNSFFAKYGNKIKRNSATEKWVMSLYDESLAEMNTTSATPGFESPYAFGKADDDTVEADGWKKIPKTNKIFKPMESKSTYKKMMTEMYGLNEAVKVKGNLKKIFGDSITDVDVDDNLNYIVQGDLDKIKSIAKKNKINIEDVEHWGIRLFIESLNEAVKYDIAAAIRAIRDYNRSGKSNEEFENMAISIVKDLGYKPTGNNVDNVMDHLGASTDRGGQIPEDPAMVKELYPLLEAVSYRDYKKDPTSTPVQKVNKGIAEVNRMLSEMEKIVNNNLRLKQEAGVDSSHFWKTTGTRFAKINERMTRISNRLKELSK